MKLQDKIEQNYIVREKNPKLTYRLISSLLEASEVEITCKQKLNAEESSSSIQNLKPRPPVRFLRDLRTHHPSPLFSRSQHDLNMLHSESYWILIPLVLHLVKEYSHIKMQTCISLKFLHAVLWTAYTVRYCWIYQIRVFRNMQTFLLSEESHFFQKNGYIQMTVINIFLLFFIIIFFNLLLVSELLVFFFESIKTSTSPPHSCIV